MASTAKKDQRPTYELIPLDAAIIQTLPEEGSMLGRLRVIGKQVKQIAKDLNAIEPEAGITGAQISGRMNVLNHHGFVVKVIVQPVGNGAGWQRTPAGKAWSDSQEVLG